MTQKQRILYDLQNPWTRCTLTAPAPTVCASKWLRDYMPRYAARILELRNDGYLIETGTCPKHKTATYTLRSRPQQLELT